jgi:hypothetical protein
VAALAGERARAQFWARDWAKKGVCVCVCVVPEWHETRLVWGCAMPQACCHGGATAAELRCACFGRKGGLRLTNSSAKGRGRSCDAHRGRIRAERPCRGASVDVLRWRMGGARGQRRCRGPPGFLTPRFGSGKACESATGVREVRGSPTVRDRGGGAKYRWQTSGAIPVVARAGVAGGELGELPGGEVKLMRALAGSGAQQGGRSMVEQGALRGGARRAVA